MAESLPVLVNLVAKAMPFRKGIAISCDAGAVINDKKVTDHHAVIPTRKLKDADLSALPAGEKAVLELVVLRLLCAVAQPHIYSETVVIAACAGGEFTAKGKTVKHPGWKALEDAYRAKTKDAEPKKEGAEKALPELTEGQTLSVSAAIVKEGKSSPPQHFTEDTLLSAMETAGKRICRRMPSEKVWGHRPPVPVFWKSWYLPVFWNEKRAGKRCSFSLPTMQFP